VTKPAITLHFIAKQPVPGRVKPHLVPPRAHQQAADAVFGPVADGGFWALGLRVPDPTLLRGVPVSTPDTDASQRVWLPAAGLRVADLPVQALKGTA
jgi:uncharacterized protein